MHKVKQNHLLAGALITIFSTNILAGTSDLFGGGNGSQKKTITTSSNEIKKITDEAEAFAQNKSQKLAPFFKNLWMEGERNAVLNLDYLGLAAIEAGDLNVAKAAFDESILRFETIYSGDKSAEKAKSLWNKEEVKDFKGEPYERSMAYYYRGILYLKDGDYQNARAAFLSAERHDTFSEVEKFQGDFGLMNFLAAWSSYCDGDDSRGRELFSRAVDQDKTHFGFIKYDLPYIVLTETGGAPQKVGAGKFNEVLQIVPSKDVDKFKKIHFNNSNPILVSNSPSLVGDVTFQATTRGGRPVQGILNGKANFKDNLNTAGDTAVAVGTTVMTTSAYSGNNDAATAGALIAVIGFFSKAVSSAVTPKADIRAWSTLPSNVYLSQMKALPKNPSMGIDYFDDDNSVKPFATSISNKTKSCGFTWNRTRSALTTDKGGVANINQLPEIDESNRSDKNNAFRIMLQERFLSNPSSTALN